MAGGQGITSAQGSVGRAITLALVGIAIAVSGGSVTPNNDNTVPLTGQSVSISQGSPTPDYSRAPTGHAITSAQTSPGVSLRPTDIVGQSVATSAGTVTPSGSGVTVHISGVEAAFSQGEVDGGSRFPTGQSISTALGTQTPTLSLPLSGNQISSALGNVSPAQEADDTYISSAQGTAAAAIDVALTGVSVSTAQGTLTVTGDADVALTGIEITSVAGTVIYDRQEPLSGSQITSAQYNVGAPGGASLTGIEIVTIAGDVFTTNDRSFALTGQSVSVQSGTTFASPLAFVSGQELVASAQEIGPRDVTLSGQEIVSDTGVMFPPRVKSDDAGRPKRKKYRVEVDGVGYEVHSKEEAQELLAKVAELAAERAAEVKARAEKAEKRPVRKVLSDARKSLQEPLIVTDAPVDVEAAQTAIRDIYSETLAQIEALKREEEEDDFILMLL